ncbi:MAG: hypothetical protein NC213_03435 [Acetobacter sp.]|nr:hypothetical protein [Bacteroides sp.]MCM1340776.1 hypothetical protein [Acetobacter sp.]MCM1432667.1 hypothetical protein [Clostridiales bacterium]
MKIKNDSLSLKDDNMSLGSINKLDWQDHLRNLLIALTGAVPYIGGPISVLLDKYIPERHQKRLSDFFDSLFSDLKQIEEEKVNQNYLKSEEFGYLLEETIERIVKTYQKEKIEAYKNILLNSITDKETNQDVKEIYLHLVDELTDYDLDVLKHIHNGYEVGFTSGFCKERARQEDKSEMRNAVFDMFRHIYDQGNLNWKIDLYSVVLHLISKKLLLEDDLVYEHFKNMDDETLLNDPSIISGKYLYDVKGYLTSLSSGFIDFIIKS